LGRWQICADFISGSRLPNNCVLAIYGDVKAAAGEKGGGKSFWQMEK